MDRAEQYKKDIEDLIDQIDYNVSLIEQDFNENQDDVRHCVGGAYLKGQLKVYNELRECLEQILEEEE